MRFSTDSSSQGVAGDRSTAWSQAAHLPDMAATVEADVSRALAEDVSTGDLTAALVDGSRTARARVLAREDAVVCGAPWVQAAFERVVPGGQLVWHVAEGQRCAPNQVVMEMSGPAPALLTAERTMLNFLQLLSGVATRTALYVDAVKGTRAHIVDTRKTLPGLRVAQKYAVWVGGGTNHRMGLYDAILIKENHIAAAGSVTAALKNAQALVAAQASPLREQITIQVEVETLDQLREALAAGATSVLLDNFSNDMMRDAVSINDGVSQGAALLEVSGGVTMDQLRGIAATGVDRISIGKLTKDVIAVDFSLRVLERISG